MGLTKKKKKLNSNLKIHIQKYDRVLFGLFVNLHRFFDLASNLIKQFYQKTCIFFSDIFNEIFQINALSKKIAQK